MSRPEQLAETLRRASRPTMLLGDDVLVAPFCGRVLAVGPGAGKNALWLNPALESPETAKKLLSSTAWINPGGDRIWISPEIETHVANPLRMMDTYEVPAGVDPGAYQVTSQADDEGVTFSNASTVRFLRSKVDVPLEWTVTVSRLTNPPIDTGGDVIAAGYRTRTTLRHGARLQPGVHPAIWRLLQVPGGGTITALTRRRIAPMTFFGTPVYDVDETSVSCRVTNPISSKFGLAAEDSRGVLLYRDNRPDRSDLIVRQFNPDPDALYSDVPCTQSDVPGQAVQVYVDDGSLGGFGEMEHHSPALSGASGPNGMTDECDTWVYRGPGFAIDRVQVAAESSAEAIG